MLAKSFVVAMAADIARSDYTKPTSATAAAVPVPSIPRPAPF
jgi:hypothetical protein